MISSQAAAEELGAKFHAIDDCGHVPYVEQPEALWAIARPFLAKTDALIAMK